MDVLLVDLDDTLIPDHAARDSAMQVTLTTFGSSAALAAVWPLVREEWRASGLPSVPALAGVSSWEALWTDLAVAVTDPAAREAGRAYQARVWQRLLPFTDAATAGATFCRAREECVVPFDWVPEVLSAWAAVNDLWCVTNGSSWLQRRKLVLAGLQTRFREVVISGEIGAGKSEPRFCDEVAARLASSGSTPVALVGDSDASDGALASLLGVRHLRVRPGMRPAEEPFKQPHL